MKSKSVDLQRLPKTHDKTLDFIGFYKNVSEPNVDGIDTVNNNSVNAKDNHETPRREHSPRKYRNKSRGNMNISKTDDIGTTANTSPRGGPSLNEVIPKPYEPSTKPVKIKSIIKTTSFNRDDAMDGSQTDLSVSKPKKRNKSVSFVLDDNETLSKRTKSSNPTNIDKKYKVETIFKNKKKNIKINEKGLPTDTGKYQQQSENINSTQNKPSIKTIDAPAGPSTDTPASVETDTQEKKEKGKKVKKIKRQEINTQQTENNEQATKNNTNVQNKKKWQSKQQADTADNGEPAAKISKTDVKPDIITEDMKNLHIGDNAHTLSNLLDEMSVVDKNKQKKMRKMFNKNKSPKGKQDGKTEETDNSEELKEKVKWNKRKWNKDKKGDAIGGNASTVVVENLPIALMLDHKKLLGEYFGECGLIKNIGIAETYPTSESKPVFTTTIHFAAIESAEKALEKDNTTFEGSTIRVRRPLPPTVTTVVIKSYGDLTDQAISSAFNGAGRIRCIRQIVKGKKSMSTTFVEFDGPKSVAEAMKMAKDTKINGKKIHVVNFQMRKNATTSPDGSAEETSQASDE